MRRLVPVLVAVFLSLLSRGTAAEDDPPSDPASSQSDCRRADQPIRVTFRQNVTLEELVAWAMGFSCKNFIYAEDIVARAKKVSILSPEEVSPDGAWALFETALASIDLTVVPRGKVLEIVETAKADSRPLPFTDGAPALSPNMARVVVQPEHLSLAEATELFSSLKSAQGKVAPLESSGLVVVTDHGDHLRGLLSLFREVDIPRSDRRLYAMAVPPGDAERLGEILREILAAEATRAPAPAAPSGKSPGKAATPTTGREPASIWIDAASGTLLLLGNQATFDRARALVARLARSSAGGAQYHRVKLEHADAEVVAQTLLPLLSGGAPVASGSGSGDAAPRPPPASEGAVARIEGDVRLASDSETNSILVVATPRDADAVRQLIVALDEPRNQVFIEATIMEISLENTRALGTSFHQAKPGRDGAVWLTGLRQSELSTLTPFGDENSTGVQSLSGFLLGVLGKPLPDSEILLGQSIPSFGMLFHALATADEVDILSAPHLMTTNNKEASLSVGRNVPFTTGLGLNATGGALQSIDREEINLTLKVTPHVNSAGMVRLDIDLSIKDLVPTGDALQPTWTERTVQNTVVVADQESIVIGGLVSEKTQSVDRKIPLLGDIPILGHLFKSSETASHKANLLILLTPYVISGPGEGSRIARRKLREREEFSRAHRGLSTAAFDPAVDYRRKRGLLGEIDHQVRAAERERQARDALRDELRPPDGPVDTNPSPVPPGAKRRQQ